MRLHHAGRRQADQLCDRDGIGSVQEHCATGDLAAVMAIAARCYGPYDAAYAANAWRRRSRRGPGRWLIRMCIFENPQGRWHGRVWRQGLAAMRLLWASAELWRTTGDAEYEKAFWSARRYCRRSRSYGCRPWPGDVASLAYWTYAVADPRRQSSGIEEADSRPHRGRAAETLVSAAEVSGYGNTLASEDFTWGSNSVAGQPVAAAAHGAPLSWRGELAGGGAGQSALPAGTELLWGFVGDAGGVESVSASASSAEWRQIASPRRGRGCCLADRMDVTRRRGGADFSQDAADAHVGGRSACVFHERGGDQLERAAGVPAGRGTGGSTLSCGADAEFHLHPQQRPFFTFAKM